MRSSLFILVFGLSSLAACGDKVDPLVKEVLGKLTAFRDEGCACTDVECVTKVQNQVGSWMLNERERLAQLDKKATPKQNQAGQKLSAELNACAQKLLKTR